MQTFDNSDHLQRFEIVRIPASFDEPFEVVYNIPNAYCQIPFDRQSTSAISPPSILTSWRSFLLKGHKQHFISVWFIQFALPFQKIKILNIVKCWANISFEISGISFANMRAIKCCLFIDEQKKNSLYAVDSYYKCVQDCEISGFT